VRPTSDRLRETLFNILAPRMRGSRFLDLCAGSGAVGIEALSRGASEVVFIEDSRRACLVIEANLRMLSLDAGFTLICRDANAALTQLAETSQRFDIVFFDPPYASGLYDDVLSELAVSAIVLPGSIVIVEHRAKDRLASAYSNLELYRQVKQGESALSFYELHDAQSNS
jgi:16S rRNA (guanine966-N2)-methyltransferase